MNGKQFSNRNSVRMIYESILRMEDFAKNIYTKTSNKQFIEFQFTEYVLKQIDSYTKIQILLTSLLSDDHVFKSVIGIIQQPIRVVLPFARTIRINNSKTSSTTIRTIIIIVPIIMIIIRIIIIIS